MHATSEGVGGKREEKGWRNISKRCKTRLAAGKVEATSQRESQPQQEDADDCDNDPKANGLDKHSALKFLRLFFELEGVFVECVSASNEKLDAFATAENSVNVIDHLGPGGLDLRACGGDLVSIRIVVVVLHAIRDGSAEDIVEGVGHSGLYTLGGVRAREDRLKIREEGEDDTTGELFVGHTQVGDAVFHNVVEDVRVVSKRHLLALVVGRDLLKDNSRHHNEVAIRCCIFCKDRISS